MADEEHLVCNHTYTHKNVTDMSAQDIQNELTKLEQAYTDLTKKTMSKYFRPPEGTFDQDSLKVVYDQGYRTVFWSFAYADWDNNKQMSPQEAKKKIMDNLHNGEIMLLHPTSATNAMILSDVISELKVLGYRFGTLDELEVTAS
jgi:peptidoglycan-N-acetylmuramic acid deacetylase